MDRARLLLDLLMGPNRDKIEKTVADFTDICKFMLVKFCPFKLLHDIKFSIGNCPFKRHEEYFVSLYKQEGCPDREKYELELYDLMLWIFLNNYENVLLRKEKIIDSLGSLLVIKNCAMDFETDKLFEKIEDNKAFDRCAFNEELKKIKGTYDLDMLLCECCGKDMDRSNIQSHLKSKYHCAFMRIEMALEELLEKYSGINEVALNAVKRKVKEKNVM